MASPFHTVLDTTLETTETTVGPRRDLRETLERLASGEPLVLAERYRVEARLAGGGMSEVFSGTELATGRRVAIKFLKDELADEPEAIACMVREARLLAQIHHPNVVEVVDVGTTSGGSTFVVTELLVGEDLSGYIARRGPLTWEQAKPLILQMCAALAAVHAHGIVHRDIKPANCVVVDDDGAPQIKLLDFGVAFASSTSKSSATAGTPAYMAPELGGECQGTRRSDVYALGLVLCEMLTGTLPFCSGTVAEIRLAHRCLPPPSLASLAPLRAIAPGLDRIYARTLAKRPSERYADTTALAADLESVDSETTDAAGSTHTIDWVAASSFVLALLTSLYWAYGG